MIRKIKNNNKGFTLIELLAVIVILGVLMIIAIPMVSKYIRQSKQSAFIDTAKAYVQAARYAYFNDEYECANSSDVADVYIIFDDIDVDKSNGKSPYNKAINTTSSYVRITPDGDGKYIYKVAMTDGVNGFSEKDEKSLKREDVGALTSISAPEGSTKCTKTS